MAIAGAIVSFVTGGLAGLIDKGLGIWSDQLEHKRNMEMDAQNNGHEKDMFGLRMEASRAGHEAGREIALIEADERALDGSFKHDAALDPVSGWVHDVRAMVRPGLTGALVVAVVGIYAATTAADLASAITLAVVEMTAAAVGWWFASRPRKSMSLKIDGASVERSETRGPLSRPSRMEPIVSPGDPA